MGFKDLLSNDLANKVQTLTDTAAVAVGKILDEFNEALPTMRALGFTVRDFKMSMSAVPELSAKLIASADTINVGRIKELTERYKEKKLLVTLLKALELAYNLKDQIGDTGFKSVEMDITLGFPPHISVGFGGNPAAQAVAAGAARG